MKQHDDFLVEIHTEELPPKSLKKLAEAFCRQVKEQLQKANLTFKECRYFAAPRRLAVLVHELASSTPDQVVERKGPALSAAFDVKGNPSPACVGFAKSCGVTPADLLTLKTAQGEWVGYQQSVKGKTVFELLPDVVTQSLNALPIPKRMHWGDKDVEFVRPVHSVIMLYGKEVVPANILGCEANRLTEGHRFLSSGWITIPEALQYEHLLETEGKVIVDFEKRKSEIKKQAESCVKKLDKQYTLGVDQEELYDEVTGLVEWPTALCGTFDEKFLTVPQEALISSMEDHQRYFPVLDGQGKLLPTFIVISNIDPRDKKRVIHGNERVLRARLSDAAFFYETDKKEKLADRVNKLKHIVFQAKLGTLFDKAERLRHLAGFIATKINASAKEAERAGFLAKADLTSSMVGEFPELQGIMGRYYALNEGEQEAVAAAMQDQYMPVGAQGALPVTLVGVALALADRIDTLVGYFGINQLPTGDKDPYGLRRAAIAILRILIEKKIDLDLKEVFDFAIKNYSITFENKELLAQLLGFMQERLKSYYQDQGISADVFAAVAALSVSNPLDMDKRVKAVTAFKKLTEAESLSVANKRVSNILAKYDGKLSNKTTNPTLFEHDEEKKLFEQLEKQYAAIKKLGGDKDYEKILLTLASLRQPVDAFFDHVMVMTDDKAKQENRILLLTSLRNLFLQVADIALLQ